MANFWWGSDAHLRKIHWIAWERLCLSKESGGMGFRDLEAFNQALLAKQAWKVLSSPQCLLAQVLKSRYFPNSNFLKAKIGDKPSYAWRSLLFGRELLIKDLQKRVGDGNSINVWTDRWIEDEADGYGIRAPWIKNCTFNVNLRARDLIDFQNRRWNVQALEEVLVPSDIQIIIKNQPVTSKEDFWSWKLNKSGAYSVKSGYWLAFREKSKELRSWVEALPSINSLKAQVWKVQAGPKIKIFVWKALSQALPVAELLSERGMKCDERCQLCGFEGESVNHVLFSCNLARQCWALSNIPSPRNGFNDESIYENLDYLLTLSKAEEISRKVKKEADAWFLAQQVQNGMEEVEASVRVKGATKENHAVLGGWILYENGRVLEHSRRAFSDVKTVGEAKLQMWLWVMERMKSLRKKKVRFVSTFGDYVKAIEKPIFRPALQYEASEIKRELQGFEAWELRIGSPVTVRCASLIA
ncbi:PREDICTED: uncharacterized protein LOC106339898 [Brassica oleracea var. oleracea]|uniref:uncharacterized protein LOC106339898 n=1 Tax=Brassica oleracea var. oleracea TaxID=109376 RepID=UPI0006A70FD3|nr:PREDICTED: uncharacterized protein LOC106339898 [Brassica oleracea var. oleracea]